MQATGRPWRVANITALREWSPCSCETSTAAISEGVSSGRRDPLLQFPAGKPGLDQQGGGSRRDQRRVAGTPGAEDAQADFHGKEPQKRAEERGFGGGQTTIRPRDPSTPGPQHIGVPRTSEHNRLWNEGNAGQFSRWGLSHRLGGAKGLDRRPPVGTRWPEASARFIAALPHGMQARKRRTSGRHRQPKACGTAHC